MTAKPGFFTSAYLPAVEYFMMLSGYQEIQIEQHENYQKQSYRNRCRISGPNGINVLTVPVDKKGNVKVTVRDLKISYSENWQKLHWRSIQTAYNNSPFFLYYRDEMERFYTKRYDYLLDLNQDLLLLIIKWLKLNTGIVLTKSFIPLYTVENDFRYVIHPKNESSIVQPEYHQVFIDKFGFIPNLSIIDLIFNEGPGASGLLII